MKVLVTGGAGFIGSAVVRLLVGELDVEVVNLDALTYAGNLDSLTPIANRPRYRFVQGDVCDAKLLSDLFAAEQPDVVMHLAAESHVDRSIDGPAAFINTNVIGTYTMLEAARTYWSALPARQKDTFRFHHISTDEVFGSLGPDEKFTETTRYAPNSPYSASKAGSDHLVRAWHHTYGLPVVTTNCSNNYGPYHFPEKLVPLMILNGLEGKPLPVYGAGQNVRDWLYVEDHARALWLAVTRGQVGQVYNIGGEAEYANIAVVQTICDLLDELAPGDKPRRDLITFVADRPGHDLRYAMDITKISGELGWRPQETFTSGLRKTVMWYLANRAWWTKIREGRYAGQRLGLGEKKNRMSCDILLTGANGQLGWEVQRRAATHGLAVQGFTHAALDIADQGTVQRMVEMRRPRFVVNAAAYTAVDKAESEMDKAFAVNRDGPAHLAAACARANIPLVHISTDYVFDGQKTGPYREDDAVAPLGVYGASKLAGEQAVQSSGAKHVILRTAWVYGVHGHNFVKTMLRLGQERDVLRVVDDQYGCPTFAGDLAEAILMLIGRLAAPADDAWGVFHCVGGGETTWCEFARAIFAEAGPCLERVPRVDAITTADYPTPARRPANSVLDGGKLKRVHGIALRPWPAALAEMLSEPPLTPAA